jgi:molecular chaperone Hsp33
MTQTDDMVLPFQVKTLGARGRLVRLGPVIHDILSRHDYPAPVSALLAEAVALAALLGSALKFEGRFILQTKTDGPVDLIVADFASPNGVRGYARYDLARIAAMERPTQAALLGQGYLAMTVDQGGDMDRYQGIVPLEGISLAQAADIYFAQSEQIPTRLKLASGPLTTRDGTHWRAGAVMVQHLPGEGGHGDASRDDDWATAHMLLDTVEDHELLDPQLGAEALLYRLYHEPGVTAYPAIALARHCTCSRDAVERMIRNFPADDRAAMVHDGAITVTCEFCSSVYGFKPSEFAASPAED